MAAYKCKMCGGDLTIEPGSSVCECEYCGSKQTVPTADNEKKMTMFGRANKLLRECDFDRAAAVYENIVAEFPEEAEAYWGLVLCNYGIEYVDDPASSRKVPTCHRSSYESVLKDGNYALATDYADAAARRVYRAEAIAIEELRKNIIEVSGKEEPYDVFISYKETDENGERTLDSVIAQDIYDALTEKGCRVFFSRISLESKLGTEYEPYIFAALHSAKVMLVVGTDYEYFNAVWVKNEWSRYLKLMAADRKKSLIPCYKDISAYDMPEEFNKLTAQDMGKLGAMQDLVRGVLKLTGKDEAAAPAKQEPVVVQQVMGGVNVASLLDRMFLYLEDGKWQEANTYAEKVLDADSRNAEAYLGKLMAQQHVCVRGELKDCSDPIEGIDAYKKAVRFGSAELIAELEGYNTHIITRNNNDTYDLAQNRMTSAKTENEYKGAAQLFGEIPGWKDANAKKAECLELAETARKDAIYADAADKVKRAARENDYKAAAAEFGKIPGWKDADAKKTECLELAEAARKDTTYAVAVQKMKPARTENDYKSAAAEFGKIPGWKDADAKKAECLNQAETVRKDAIYAIGCAGMMKKTIPDYRAAIEQFSGIADWKDSGAKIKECEQAIADLEAQAEAARIAAEKKKKKTQKTVTIAAIVAALATVAVVLYVLVVRPPMQYNKAVALRNNGDVAAAAQAFVKAGGYKDAREQATALYSDLGGRIAAGDAHTVGLRSDGTVVAVGENGDGRCSISGWTDIVAVACGKYHTVGLRNDGTVVAVGNNGNGRCNVSGWTNIVAVACGNAHTVGLRSDGMVVADGYNGDGRCDVSSWTDMVAVACGDWHTVGLRSDGTVVAAGNNGDGRCDVSGWTDIMAVACGNAHTVGLRSDGTVVAVGDNEYGQCDVNGWTNIVAVACGAYHTVGLRSDGTVVAVGSNYYGKCDVSDWKDIVAVACGDYHTVGLRSNGTVVAVGYNDEGQCNVSGWKDLLITYEEQ